MKFLETQKLLIKRKSGVYYLLSGVLSIIIILFAASNLSFTHLPEENKTSEENFPQNYKIVSPKVPDNISIFGEQVPLENFEVYERVDREILVNTYWHSSTILAIKRANRWFPVIEPILKANNIPDDVKYLAVIESNLENVVSPAGATGFWQFVKPAGVKYGLEINDQVDERYNVEKSTQAACNYLNEAYIKFGSWTMAAASFNAGVNGMDKWSGLQKAKNYWNLVLGSETSRYIPRMIALKIIMQNPAAYGYALKEDDLYKPLKFKEIDLNSSIVDFADYAASLGINYKTLKLYNPWLRDTSLKIKSGTMYKIKVPEEGSIHLIKE